MGSWSTFIFKSEDQLKSAMTSKLTGGILLTILGSYRNTKIYKSVCQDYVSISYFKSKPKSHNNGILNVAKPKMELEQLFVACC